MYLSRLTVTTRRDARNDIFTICELLQLAYYDAVSVTNIIAGSSRFGLWCAETRGPDMSRIRAVEYTSGEVNSMLSDCTMTRSRMAIAEASDEPRVHIENSKQRYALFLRNAEKIFSYGTVEENGTVKVTTRSSATLTSDNVNVAVRAADERKRSNAVREEAAASAQEQRRAER
eukprot:IDg15722t1